jgi:hypothetical protein
MALINVFRTDGWVKTVQGPAVPGAQVYVCLQPANSTILPPTPLANIFSDVNGLVPLSQPIITDGFGHYDFYAAAGIYTIIVALGGIVQQVYPDQSVGGFSGTGGGGGGTALTLQVNGVNLSSQTVQNLTAGSGIGLTDEGAGSVLISNTSTGGGVLGKWVGNWIGSNAAGFTGTGSITPSGNFGMDMQQVVGQPQTVLAPTATSPLGIQFQSPSLNTASGFMDFSANITLGILKDWFVNEQIVGTTASRYFIGLTNTTSGNVPTTFPTDTPNTVFIGFRWSAGTDVNIKAMCCTSSANITVVDTGVSSVTARHTYEIVPTVGGAVTFYIDGVLVATISSNVTPATTPLATIMTVDGQNSGSTTFNANFYYAYALISS